MSKNNQYESDAYLDQLSMEQLEDLLRADLNSPDEENDEAVFHILEVMKKREKENPTGRLPDKNKAWKEFQEYYNIPEGEGESLYPTYSEPENDDKNIQTLKTNEPRTRPRFRMRRGLVVAAILIVMFGSMLTAQAAGLDVFGAIGRWTEETFHFELPINHDDLAGETDYNLRNASQKAGLPGSVAPIWCPEGFVPKTPTNTHIEDYVDTAVCEYINENENRSYFVDILYYYNSSDVEATIFEKDDSEVVTYSSNRGTFYIFSNIDVLAATWSNGHLSITVAGDLQLEELEKIIDSIGD